MSRRVSARYEQFGVDLWALKPPPGTPPHESCHLHAELSPAGYDRVFKRLKRAAGRRADAITDLGAGLGRAVAHAVATRAFKSAVGVEVLAARVQAAERALADLALDRRGASVELQSFCAPSYAVRTPCALAVDIAFDRATLAALAPRLDESSELLAFVSFRPALRWREAGLRCFETVESGRVRSTGEERFTYYVYKRRRTVREL